MTAKFVCGKQLSFQFQLVGFHQKPTLSLVMDNLMGDMKDEVP